MRWIGWLLLLLVLTGWLTSQIEVSKPPTVFAADRDCWRRTRDGWEKADWLIPEPSVRRPAIHPSVIGLVELFVSLIALVAFGSNHATGDPKRRWEPDHRQPGLPRRGLRRRTLSGPARSQGRRLTHRS